MILKTIFERVFMNTEKIKPYNLSMAERLAGRTYGMTTTEASYEARTIWPMLSHEEAWELANWAGALIDY